MSAHAAILELRRRMGQSIIGQEDIIERLILGLLCNGNLLVEGLTGLAKTRAVKSLAKALESDFSRITEFSKAVRRGKRSLLAGDANRAGPQDPLPPLNPVAG